MPGFSLDQAPYREPGDSQAHGGAGHAWADERCVQSSAKVRRL